MTNPACPDCSSTHVRLLDISKLAWVDYFCCDSCHRSWNVPKPREIDNRGRVGHMTYEGEFVIIPVPPQWTAADGLPAPGPEDRWFKSVIEFETVLGGPWDHKPINRKRWSGEALTAKATSVPQR